MTRRQSPAPGDSRGMVGGRGYTDAVSNLYRNDTPPACERLYRPRRVGEIVTVDHLPGTRLEVVALDDPALVTLRTPNGATLKAGWRTIRRLS